MAFKATIIAWIMAFCGTSMAVESLQLEHVPVDSGLGCERVFFKSSQNFKGTIYVLPVVMLANDEYGEPIVTSDVNPNGQDGFNYLLNFKIFFPNDDADMRANAHIDDAAKLPRCNFEAVKNSLNKNLPEDKKIQTIAYMPLTSIEVTIPDFTSKHSLIGREASDSEADLIAYQGAAFNISIPMNDFEKSSVLDALTREEGMQARIRMRFKAHKQDGALNVKIDMSQLAVNFKAAAKGEKLILKASLEATIRAAIANTSIQIDSSQSSSEAFNDLTKQIVDKVLSEVKIVTDIAPKPLEGQAADAGAEKISVAVVADFLATRSSTEFVVRHSTAEEVATAETVVSLQAALGDPNIRVMRVASGDATESTLSETINKGQTFHITPATYALQKMEYQERVTYVTAQELRNNYVEIDEVADMITDGNFTVENQERNYVLLAVGHWSWWQANYWFNEIVWKRVERTPVIIKNPRVKIDLDRASYSRFPVYVTFSALGGQRKMFTFEEMMTETPSWSGRYDDETGSIIVTAKKDLGLMALRPRFKLDENNDAGDFAIIKRPVCGQLTGQAKMNCYFPACKDLGFDPKCEDKKLYPTEHEKHQCDMDAYEIRLNCLNVDFLRTTVVIEELIREHRSPGGVELKSFDIRTSGRATTRQRVIYYNITLPRTTKAP
jgi:hypothetical protein